MRTINHSARFAQWRNSRFQPLRVPRAATWRLVLLVAVAGAAYVPGAMVAHGPLAHSTVSSHMRVAVQPNLPCPGVTLPC